MIVILITKGFFGTFISNLAFVISKCISLSFSFLTDNGISLLRPNVFTGLLSLRELLVHITQEIRHAFIRRWGSSRKYLKLVDFCDWQYREGGSN